MNNEPTLFEQINLSNRSKNSPLPIRMRPTSLEEFIGQKHILGKGKLLRRAIQADKISSLILYGPPGSGKTTLAYVISNITKAQFICLNAAVSNVNDIRQAIIKAKRGRSLNNQRTILFIDEIHRFNKAQQDVLMPDVEQGNVILIGATVHNPFFSIVSPLLSRSLIFELNPLTADELMTVLRAALSDKQRGLGGLAINMEHDALRHLAGVSGGDCRRALNALEIGALTTDPDKDGVINYTSKVAEQSIQKKMVVYDKGGDGHYDSASAFIKSMRGTDPDAALYWLAKMLYSGEDPRFIARRIVICAAEDVGNADPQALILANAALQISEFVGMPEARIPLAQAVTYIASAPKSNASYLAIEAATEDIKKQKGLNVPEFLKDSHYPGAERLGRGKGYKYSHDYKGHFVKQDYLSQKKVFYKPTGIGYEKVIKERLNNQAARPKTP
ncbi:MAG: replication-associated recombination protein A [Candidatus Omnitrophota bacterium]|nr:replication-associated recombination protein A [Candidatus Omnitrophota bacterium]